MTDTVAIPDAATLTDAERDTLTGVGFDDMASRAATAILTDAEVRLTQTNDSGVEIMPLKVALNTYEFVQDLMFGLVDADANEHIAMIAEHMHDPLGHFVWVRPGAKIRLPVQTFSLMETPQSRQFTHDITLIDEGAEVEMISGAAAPSEVHRGRHISLSETYMRPGSRCRSVSIEHWGPGMEIHSYSHSRLERGVHENSTSIALSPIRHQVSQSRTVLEEDAVEVSQAICFAPEGTERLMRSETHLTGAGARSEDLTRMVSAGGRIVNDSLLIGEAAGSQGFLGCDGLKLGQEGEILAIPSLQAMAEGSQLSHEASVGMIDDAKLNYLMAAGMEEDAARDLIVQGFLALDDAAVPDSLKARVAKMIAQAKSGGM